MQKINESETTQENFRRGLEVLMHLRDQVSELGDRANLDLLVAVGSEPFSNSDAREALQVKRQASWKRLAEMSEAGLILKRGHSYRVAPFTKELVSALASTLGALVTGRQVVQPSPALETALESALEGLEVLYSKGKLSQEAYSRQRATLQELVSNGPS